MVDDDNPDVIGSNERRRPTTAVAVVGGSLVVATAALTILGWVDAANDNIHSVEAITKQYEYPTKLLLPLPPSQSPIGSPSLAPSSSASPSQRPSSSTNPTVQPSSSPTNSSQPSSIPSEAPSVTSKPSDTPSSLPSGRPSDIPSTQPSLFPSISKSPTYYPTASPTYPPSLQHSSSPSELAYSLGIFNLRLHWQPGYMWQESTEESWFCIACATCDTNVFDKHCEIQSNCEEGMGLALVKCLDERKRRELTTFTLVTRSGGLFSDTSFEGAQVRVYDTILCLELEGREILLRQCNSSKKEQRFLGFRSGGQAMELLPEGSFKRRGVEIDRCLSQHHHPRQGERIYAEECRLARISDTNLWTTY